MGRPQSVRIRLRLLYAAHTSDLCPRIAYANWLQICMVIELARYQRSRRNAPHLDRYVCLLVSNESKSWDSAPSKHPLSPTDRPTAVVAP
ncbi:hypothetical protein FOMPIDRAFT_1025198 [Fomitopsis schrenkii]|uniref:Uncharacterized protein n=1 Tax=Fomitopsis schrenkii TaxID=2126942 RepID=S8DW72_FOMSC|nr:hypothetical protein FOMPIDRAFT_1025198 [Fomitopsis schrenkii]